MAPHVEFCSNDWKCMICYIIASSYIELSLSNAKYLSLSIWISPHQIQLASPIVTTQCYLQGGDEGRKSVFAKDIFMVK